MKIWHYQILLSVVTRPRIRLRLTHCANKNENRWQIKQNNGMQTNNNIYLTHSIVFYNKGKMITILILLEYKICHSAKFLKISSEQTVTQMLRRNNNRPLYLRDKMMGVTCYFIEQRNLGDFQCFGFYFCHNSAFSRNQILYVTASLASHATEKRFFFQNGLAIISSIVIAIRRQLGAVQCWLNNLLWDDDIFTYLLAVPCV